jgi:hypothetical protein
LFRMFRVIRTVYTVQMQTLIVAAVWTLFATSGQEVSKILGRPVGRARPVKRTTDGNTECRYASGLEGTITIMVGRGIPKAKWDAFMNELKASGASLDPVAGVGDGANFWDDRLYAHTGSYEITISTSPTSGSSLEKVRAEAVALAKAVVGKLKG